METKRNRLLFALACMAIGLAGCREEASPVDTALEQAEKKDREIQAGLNLVTNWQSHFELLYFKRDRFLNNLKHAIMFEADNERYKKYMGWFVDAAFSIPTDSEDSRTRAHQLDSFCYMTESVMKCAGGHDDWNTYWTIGLRRLERIKAELQKIKVHLPNGEPHWDEEKGEWPVLGHDGWDNCFGIVKVEYGHSVHGLKSTINNFLMTRVLTYDKWVEYHSRLEKIIGSKVPIKDVMFKSWDMRKALLEKRRREAIAVQKRKERNKSK